MIVFHASIRRAVLVFFNEVLGSSPPRSTGLAPPQCLRNWLDGELLPDPTFPPPAAIMNGLSMLCYPETGRLQITAPFNVTGHSLIGRRRHHPLVDHAGRMSIGYPISCALVFNISAWAVVSRRPLWRLAYRCASAWLTIQATASSVEVCGFEPHSFRIMSPDDRQSIPLIRLRTPEITSWSITPINPDTAR